MINTNPFDVMRVALSLMSSTLQVLEEKLDRPPKQDMYGDLDDPPDELIEILARNQHESWCRGGADAQFWARANFGEDHYEKVKSSVYEKLTAEDKAPNQNQARAVWAKIKTFYKEQS